MDFKSGYLNRKVVLAGSNGEWAQEHYLPFLIEKALTKDITLWAIDIQPEIQLNSPGSRSLWRTAETAGRAHYMNADTDMASPGIPRDIDFVFIVTPDRCHCEVAEFWLSRLSTTAKIFIEKPLDASVEVAQRLRARIPNNNVVYGFDHYLASLHPFLHRERQHLASIGDIESVEVGILESDMVPPHRVHTLKEGVILDLFPHVLAVSTATVEKKLTPTEGILRKAEFVEGARTKYRSWPFSSETYAHITFRIGHRKVAVTGVVGKGVGRTSDKWMTIHDADGRKVEIDFQTYSFSVNGKPEGNLESKHVESFLESVLEWSGIDSAPGVLSFGAAFTILERLLDIKRNTSLSPDYDIGTPPSRLP